MSDLKRSMKAQKIITIVLLVLNVIPLMLYPWVAVPALTIIRNGFVPGESMGTAFALLAFSWGVVAFPLMLIFNHWCSIRYLIRRSSGSALQHQGLTLLYLAILSSIGLIIM